MGNYPVLAFSRSTSKLQSTAMRLTPAVLAFALTTSLSAQNSSGAAPATTPATVPPDSTRLVVVKSVPAVYPITAQSDLRQGSVVVRVKISEAGAVSEATPVAGDKIFRQAATDAVKKWKFEPYIKGGKAVSVQTEIPIDFIVSSQIMQLPHASSPAPKVESTNEAASAPTRVRVAQGVMEGMIVRKVAPIYPIQAKRNHVTGTVLIQAVIRKDGLLGDLTVVSGPGELAQSAMDAVSLWRYRPYSLNGEPVEVMTTIQVNYHLNGF